VNEATSQERIIISARESCGFKDASQLIYYYQATSSHVQLCSCPFSRQNGHEYGPVRLAVYPSRAMFPAFCY